MDSLIENEPKTKPICIICGFPFSDFDGFDRRCPDCKRIIVDVGLN
jgi:predicted Zn-ribbon and HTH transcriptional regulator